MRAELVHRELLVVCSAWLLGCESQIPSGVFACEDDRDCPSGFVCAPDPADGRTFCFVRMYRGSTPLGEMPVTSEGCGFGSADSCVSTCIETDCCLEASACSSDPECHQILDCADACALEQSCITRCITRHPTGVSRLEDYLQCVHDCGCLDTETSREG